MKHYYIVQREELLIFDMNCYIRNRKKAIKLKNELKKDYPSYKNAKIFRITIEEVK